MLKMTQDFDESWAHQKKKKKSESRVKLSENQFPLMSLTQVSPSLFIFYLNM